MCRGRAGGAAPGSSPPWSSRRLILFVAVPPRTTCSTARSSPASGRADQLRLPADRAIPADVRSPRWPCSDRDGPLVLSRGQGRAPSPPPPPVGSTSAATAFGGLAAKAAFAGRSSDEATKKSRRGETQARHRPADHRTAGPPGNVGAATEARPTRHPPAGGRRPPAATPGTGRTRTDAGDAAPRSPRRARLWTRRRRPPDTAPGRVTTPAGARGNRFEPPSRSPTPTRPTEPPALPRRLFAPDHAASG